MKPLLRFLLALVAVAALVTPAVTRAATADFKRDTSPGVAVSQKLSEITGVAISPLAGVGGIGAFKYFRAKPEDRPKLSWYAQPWFFVPALLVVLACVAKDAAGPVVPTSLKKPLDVLELFENKASGIIATGAIIPMAMEVFEAVKPADGAMLDFAGAHFAAINFAGIGNLLMVPLALVVYAVVWLVSHTINVLIIVSPFTTVDAVLKGFRGAVLGSVVSLPHLNDTAGMVWTGFIVLVCLLLAPWAFRTTVFGTVFAWDILSRRKHWFTPKADNLRVFTACKVGKAPRRAFGKLTRNAGGELVFTWRPWLVFAPRAEIVPPGNYVVGKGIIHSEILRVEGEDAPDIFNLPPRCNGHEDTVAAALDLKEVRPVGLRAFWAAIKGLFAGELARV